MQTSLVPVLFTFCIQDVLKLKKYNSGAKGLIPARVFSLTVAFRTHDLPKMNRVFIDHNQALYRIMERCVECVSRDIVYTSLYSFGSLPLISIICDKRWRLTEHREKWRYVVRAETA